jgi:hypothetical protein
MNSTASGVDLPVSTRPAARLPRWTKRAFFEAVLIVFSLLLAFVVNEWREVRAQESRLREARALVAAELRFNRDSISAPEFLGHHQKLLDSYRALAAADEPQGEPIFESGVHVTTLRDAAWRALAAPEVIGRMPYREIVVLADLYQEQERLERIHWSAVPWLLAPRAADAEATHRRAFNRSVAIYLMDVVSTEQRLLKRYEDALRLLEADPLP